MVEIDCPFFTGKTEALCMDDRLYDLVIGNTVGSKLPDVSHFSAAAFTGRKLIRKRPIGNLMSLIRSLARIRMHLNRLKLVIQNLMVYDKKLNLVVLRLVVV